MYPSDIYAPRTKANKSGVTYDANKSTVLFANDVTSLDSHVVAVETELGLNPKGDFTDVAERLNNFDGVHKSFNVVVCQYGIILDTAYIAKHFLCPDNISGHYLSRVVVFVTGVDSTSAIDINIYNESQAANQIPAVITLPQGEPQYTNSFDEAGQPSIDGNTPLRFDITGTVDATGLIVSLEFTPSGF